MNRKEAIKTIEEAMEYSGLLPSEFDPDGKYPLGDACDMAIKALREPERKPGRWVYDGRRFRCSECEQAPVNKVVAHGVTVMDYTVEGTIAEVMRYCPKCGAKMDVDNG